MMWNNHSVNPPPLPLLMRGEGVRGKVPLKFGITGGDRKNLFEMGSKQEMGGAQFGLGVFVYNLSYAIKRSMCSNL